MNKALVATVLILLVLTPCVHAGGTTRDVTVSGITVTESGDFTLKFADPEWGSCTLHLRYNAGRMRGMVSSEEHRAALARLRADVARNPKVKLGYIGFGLVKVLGTESEYASDALQLREGIVYAWPAKR